MVGESLVAGNMSANGGGVFHPNVISLEVNATLNPKFRTRSSVLGVFQAAMLQMISLPPLVLASD